MKPDPHNRVVKKTGIKDTSSVHGLSLDTPETLRIFFETNPTPMWIYDIENLHIIAVNDAALAQYGFRRKEFLSMNAWDILSKNDITTLNHIAEESPTNQSKTCNIQHHNKNGSCSSIKTSAYNVLFNGHHARIVVSDYSSPEPTIETKHNHDSELWRRFMDNIPDSIYFKDKELRFTRINKSYAQFLGLSSPDDAVGKTEFDFFPPGYSHRSRKSELQILATGVPLIAHVEEVRLRDGKQHWFSTTKMPLSNGDGVINGIFGSSHDITELKRIESTLSRISDQRNLLLNITQSILSEISLNDVINKIFKSLEHVLSYDSCGLYILDEEYQVLRPTILIHPEFISPALASWTIPYGKGILGYVAQSKKGELVNNAHLDPRCIYPPGAVISCEHLISIPVMANDKPLGVIFVSRQGEPLFTVQEFEMVELFISHVAFAIQHARLFEQIVVSEERYRELFEESRDVIFISTPDGRFKDINPAGVELFGYDSKEELLSIDIREHLYTNPEDRINFMREIEQNGYVKDFEVRVRTKKGEHKTLLETTTTVRDQFNSIIGYRGIIRDITQVKELQARLLQSQKLESLGTLAGGIAHDFNNILAIILAYVSRLERGKLEPGDISKSLETIKKASWRGADLIKQILTFARRTEIVAKSIDVNDVIEDISRLLKETFPKTISLNLNLAPDLPSINADSNQLHQAIINLCVNAKDAMPDGGEITITATLDMDKIVNERFQEAKTSPYITLSISDTGHGMKEETLDRIFEPFFTTKDQGRGTGLGLAMVYGIVQNHDGFIHVDSALHSGTTVTIYLPAAPETVSILDVDSPVEPLTRRGQETILIVEDEKMLCEYLQNVLEGDGYTIITAEDGHRAVDAYMEHKDDISLVFSDIGLPGMNGWEAVKKMLKVTPSLKVIFATGYLDPEIKNEINHAGVDGFIHKPYRPEEVQKKIRVALDNQ
ncbi:MAG: PAS domain S-box protein [Bacteroidota bacterium]